MVSIPLVDGTDRIGLLELDYDAWDGGLPTGWERVVAVFVLVLIATSRYSDLWVRGASIRTAVGGGGGPVGPPPTAVVLDRRGRRRRDPRAGLRDRRGLVRLRGQRRAAGVRDRRCDRARHVSGVDVRGGDQQPAQLRAGRASSSSRAYRQADELIETRFGASYYVTGQFGSLDLPTGVLTWVNAGHVLPMLVRNGTYAGELPCKPSMPLGLGGPVVEVATQQLQRGDRVLFYTDGITESRSPDGAFFGRERLADFLVRAALDGVPVAETARRLSASVIDYVDAGLSDDATLLLIEYVGHEPGPEAARLGNRRARPSRRNSRPGSAWAGRVPSRRRSVARVLRGASCRPHATSNAPRRTMAEQRRGEPSGVVIRTSGTHGRGFRHGHRS